MRQIKRLILHHTASSRDNTTLKQIDAWHKARWPNFKSSLGFFCGYHYVIGANWIKQTRSAQENGAHTYGFNGDSIGICLTGNFETEQPTEKQLETLKGIIEQLRGIYKIPVENILGHKEVAATACPGSHLMTFIKTIRKVNSKPLPDAQNATLQTINEQRQEIGRLKSNFNELSRKYQSKIGLIKELRVALESKKSWVVKWLEAIKKNDNEDS